MKSRANLQKPAFKRGHYPDRNRPQSGVTVGGTIRETAKQPFLRLIQTGIAMNRGFAMIGRMGRLLQIHEADLAELERTLPQFQQAMMPLLDARLRTQIRRVQKILMDIRWNYGPPENVERIECDGDDAQRS